MNKTNFTKNILECEKVLYHIAKSMLQNEDDCADVMQETILIAYEKLDSLREEKYFKTWIVRILINQ